jgi:heat-inducible transcriptional repressor
MNKALQPPSGTSESPNELRELDGRSREIFKHIVETYLTTGEPVGSRNLSRHLPMSLSPASVRNVMSDLEQAGLIFSPHTSAGRMPTEQGLRLFVDALLEIGDLAPEERRQIEARVASQQQPGASIDAMLSQAGEMISGLSHCAGVVVTRKQSVRLKHVEFVRLEPTKGIVVLVSEDGQVENRIIDLPAGLPPSALQEASNYLNNTIRGLTLAEARLHIEQELALRRTELDTLAARVIEAGLATWAGGAEKRSLIVRGQSNLLSDVTAIADLDRIRRLLDDLETQGELMNLLSATEQADGVRIFIGAENRLFSLSGSSVVVAPFRDGANKIVGMLGVIGPTRLNYARIIPMVDYTARLVSRLVT